MNKKLVGFKATPEQVAKLNLLASGERMTTSDVLRRLVDLAPVRTVVETSVKIDESAIAFGRQTLGNSGFAVNP